MDETTPRIEVRGDTRAAFLLRSTLAAGADALARIRGMGPAKVRQFGAALLDGLRDDSTESV